MFASFSFERRQSYYQNIRLQDLLPFNETVAERWAQELACANQFCTAETNQSA